MLVVFNHQLAENWKMTLSSALFPWLPNFHGQDSKVNHSKSINKTVAKQQLNMIFLFHDTSVFVITVAIIIIIITS